MARRVETWLVGSAGWLVASSLTGCYTHHTADEELLNIPFPTAVYGDAGAAGKVADAAQPHDAGTCSGTNAIETFICGLSPQTGGTTGTTGTAGQASITDLIGLITGTGTTGTGQTSIADLIGLIAGTGTTGTTGTTNNPFGGTGTASGRRDAGTGMTRAGGLTTMPTAAECAAATDQFTQFLCMMQQGRGTMNPATGTTPPDAAAPIVKEDAAAPMLHEDAGVMPI